MDAIAALRPCAIDVQLGDYEYTIPALPAATWLEALLESDTDGAALLPGLLNEADQTEVWHDYVAGALPPEEIARAARDALETAGGRHWWEVDRLCRSATHRDAWALFSGKMTLKGVRLEEISLAAFVNAVYTIAMEGCKDEAERDRLKLEIEMLPPGLTDEELDELAEEDDGDTSDFVIPTEAQLDDAGA